MENKAFERAKAAYGTGAYDDATLEFIFPELKESEDERIRKDIIKILNSLPGCYWYGQKEKDDCLAYLEKQKEQKPVEWSEEDRLHYTNVLEALEYVKGCKSDYDKIEAVKSDIAWLKSLRPSWKPSEEQMDTLLWCTAHLGGVDHRVLAELYEHLKKLM